MSGLCAKTRFYEQHALTMFPAYRVFQATGIPRGQHQYSMAGSLARHSNAEIATRITRLPHHLRCVVHRVVGVLVSVALPVLMQRAVLLVQLFASSVFGDGVLLQVFGVLLQVRGFLAQSQASCALSGLIRGGLCWLVYLFPSTNSSTT